MKKKKKSRVEQLVGELVSNELSIHLSRLVRKSRKKAIREAGKLDEALRLEYHRGEGFTDAEIIDPIPPDDSENEEGTEQPL